MEQMLAELGDEIQDADQGLLVMNISLTVMSND